MPPHITVVIIDSDSESRTVIDSFLQQFSNTVQIAGSVATFAEGIKSIQKSTPHVVIMEVRDIQRGVEEISTILNGFPRTSIIATSAETSSEWILAAMRAGAVEYLLRPIAQGELLQSLQKVGRFWFAQPEEHKAVGKVITAYYPIGGVGTTTVAVNLAAALAMGDKKVALVDLNLFSGDIATFLDVNPTYTLSSVTTNVARLDANFLMSVMTRHSSGPYVLTEPVEVDEAVSITPEQVNRVLEYLRSSFDYVVVDCGGQLAGCNMAIFENSNLILFTTALSLPALKNTKRYLLALERKGFQHDRVKLVVNRYLPKADILVKDAEKVLGRTVFQTIPNEYGDVVNSINRGMPVVKLEPRSPVSRAIMSLAEQVR